MTGSISRKLYRQFLLLYPEPFRQEFGDEMLDIFEECRATQGSWRLLADVVFSAAKQQIHYLSTPVPKSAARKAASTFYSEIGASPNLARVLAVAVFGAALIAGLWAVQHNANAPECSRIVSPARRFSFPAGLISFPKCSDGADSALKPDGFLAARVSRQGRGGSGDATY